MRIKEKQILLKDFCSRLPYGVKFKYMDYDGCDYELKIISVTSINDSFPLEDCKPYLRPISSMTDEEKKKFDKFICIDILAWEGDTEIGYENQTHIMAGGIDWLLEHHFDFRGLIEMGLAIKAPEDMYK